MDFNVYLDVDFTRVQCACACHALNSLIVCRLACAVHFRFHGMPRQIRAQQIRLPMSTVFFCRTCSKTSFWPHWCGQFSRRTFCRTRMVECTGAGLHICPCDLGFPCDVDPFRLKMNTVCDSVENKAHLKFPRNTRFPPRLACRVFMSSKVFKASGFAVIWTFWPNIWIPHSGWFRAKRELVPPILKKTSQLPKLFYSQTNFLSAMTEATDKILAPFAQRPKIFTQITTTLVMLQPIYKDPITKMTTFTYSLSFWQRICCERFQISAKMEICKPNLFHNFSKFDFRLPPPQKRKPTTLSVLWVLLTTNSLKNNTKVFSSVPNISAPLFPFKNPNKNATHKKRVVHTNVRSS